MKFNYFFNSLYLLTNKTQMKMKKTQSLKLMLLGLLACFGSASAWAQFTAEKGVVYDVSGDKAVVVGVLSTLPDGEFGNGRYLDGTKSIQIANVINGKNVNGFAADWKNPEVKAKANTTTGTLPANVTSTVTNADGTQTVTIKNDGGETTTTVFPTIDATGLTAVELVLRASEITEISRSDMEGLTVAGFILGGTSGITVIPENLFSGVTRTDVPNTARDEHIAYYEGLIGNGTSYVVEDGLYNGAQVYRTFPTFWFVGSEDGKFVVVDENFTQKGANWDEDNYFVHRANAFNAEWKLETEPYWNDVRVSSDGEYLLRWVNWMHQWVPVATKFEGNLGASATPGLQSLADAAKDARDQAYAEWVAADKELTNAKYLYYNYQTINDNLAQNSAKAVALRDAIAAFGTDQWWGELKKQLKKHYTNVPEDYITPWFAAYVLSTTDEADLAPDITKSYWQEKIDNVIAAYTDFFGYAPSALKEYYVDGYLFDSYGAVGDIFSHDGLTTVNASSETFTHYTNGVVEDCSGDALTDGTVKIGDKYYFKVKVLQNGIEGWNDKYFYVQLAATEETVDGEIKVTPVIDKTAYYVLYKYEAQPAQLAASFDGRETGTIVTTLNGASAWTADYSARSAATTLTFPDGSTKDLFIFTISEGTHAGKYAINDFKLYSVDASNNATPVMGTPETKEMTPITFTPDIAVPGEIINPATDVMTQIQVTWDEENQKLTGHFPDETTPRVGLQVSEVTTLVANRYVTIPGESGDVNILVKTLYTVTEEGSWNGRYFVDEENNLYKQNEDASWITEGESKYMAATAIMMNKHTDAEYGEASTTPGENTTMVVKIGNKERYKYTLTPETAHADIDSHDPWPAYMAVINANTALDPVKLQADVNAADAKEKAAADKLDKAEKAKEAADKNLSDAKDLLNKAKQEPLYIDKYEYESRVDNNDLYEVDFNNDIVTTIGDHAFANCVNAKFNNGTFPATIETVGQEAFLRTLIATADFSTATSEDLTIAADAFKSTPLEVLKLEGTTSEDITPMKVWQIVQNLVKEETLDLEFCVTGETTTVANVNKTLTTVTLPVREDYTQILDGTFYKCWALTSVTIPTQITYIGARAFRYTNVHKFDMTETTGTNVKDLAYVGDYAFSKNPSLTEVKFAADAPVNTLRVNTFQDACALATVEFNDAMEILPEGLFATNVLAKLQLCNTAVKYLPNLFLAGPGEEEGDRQPNTTLTEVCLPDGLLAIDHFALSSCKALTEVDIPGTVFLMGDGVFYNDVNLEKVTIIDSRMIGLPARTFSQCEKLSDLVFITLETINPNPLGNNVTQEPFMTETDIQKMVNEVLGYPEFNEVDGDEDEVSIPTVPVGPWGIRIPVYTQEELDHFISLVQAGQCFGDNIFHGAGIYSTHKFKNSNGVMVPKTLVTVGYDSYMKLIGGSPVYAEAYSKLQAYDTKITFTDANKAGDSYWKTYQSKYGTWVKAGQGQIVYSAYQDGNTIILYPAKIKNGYYKIAAYDGTNDEAAASVVRSLDKEFSFEQKTNPDQKYQTTLDYENQLSILDQSFTGNSNLNVYYMAVNGTEPQFYKTIESITLPAGWIVFKTEGFLGQGARVVVIDEDDATAVQGVKEYLEGVQTGAIYNLNGVRVSTPQKGQMYIQNGKKFIQK
jgi:hypothetical protein